MDMRDKLLPIFLAETASNLKILQGFLKAWAETPGAQLPLEDAFRSAHTLKGTALLVKVDSVHQIARRVEALLEKHLAAKTRPTAVEREALELAVGWLSHLLCDLRAGRPGSSTLVADALSALDLASRFPGDTPLVELLDSVVEKRAPNLVDPFSADPDLLLDDEDILRTAKDPFADDPSFGFGFALRSAPGTEPPKTSASLHPQPEAVVAGQAAVPFDPFAEDLSFLNAEDSLPAVEAEQSVAVADEQLPLVPPADPFAEDDYLPGDNDLLVPPPTAPASGEGRSADRIKEIADWLLLPDDAAIPEHLYVCCCFELKECKYHLPIEYVIEISETPSLLSLPLAPPPVVGLVNLRGLVLPVIDLSSLNKQPLPAAGVRRLVVVEYQQEKLAFLADGIPYLSEDFIGDLIDLPTFFENYRLKGAEE